MPWPISRCLENTVTVLSVPMRRKALGLEGDWGGQPSPALPGPALAAGRGQDEAEGEAGTPLRKRRRLRLAMAISVMLFSP